ncbi:hypothetical protein [Neobacillus kokaensis]|uniref:Phosphatase n=1 Tax=Neobacillus kokaensis TaxID=2759023 RepID=A0ABQ3N1F4_9BACI|nr:hypothetical protein [Neobacillus kokaensis]GHH97695.1 hypothetical protein AM1BK_12380 [Neobacillus kokaensis]
MRKFAVLLFSLSLVFLFTTNKGVEVQKSSDVFALNSTQAYPIQPPVG